jgi:hypothetical protein
VDQRSRRLVDDRLVRESQRTDTQLFQPAWYEPFRKGSNMKSATWVGVLLIVLGGLALAYQGFTYSHQERVLDLGPIHATAEKQEHVSIPPILGGMALLGGIVLLVAGRKKPA